MYYLLGTREESSVVFDFRQLPDCHIPGSQRVSLSVTGKKLRKMKQISLFLLLR